MKIGSTALTSIKIGSTAISKVMKDGVTYWEAIGTGFITEWTVSGDATARTITLPLVNTRAEGALAYNCLIDWGDNTSYSTVTSYNDANRIHTYAANGTYQVNINGTCEGWSFNNAGDKLKITKVINWGESAYFNGFKYLKGGFYGCTNFTSLGTGKILASGTGVLTDGFYETFRSCRFATIPAGLFDNHTEVTSNAFYFTFSFNTSLTSITADLFKYNTKASTGGFSGVFSSCPHTSLTSIPADLFKYNTLVTTDAFYQAFFGCTSLTTIPVDLFRYNTEVSSRGFMQTFRACSISSIPTDLFRYNTKVTTYAFYDCFQDGGNFTTLPDDLFRYNILASTNAFQGTFIGNDLTTLPVDLFRYNTNVTTYGFSETFANCVNLETVPAGLFKYNHPGGLNMFYLTFSNCNKLQLNANIFYADGEQSTRFLDTIADFNSCFNRTSFTGTQGVAPDLWNCTFPVKLELSTRPATIWVAGDIITGQTSGVTSEVTAWFGTWIVLVKNVSGTYLSDETIGVTGVPAKLANQSLGYPIQTNTPIVKTDCFNGAGNSLTSLSNYASIPAEWL
jgi:hypothetical protein